MPCHDYRVQFAVWNQHKSILRTIRENVFIIEQKVPKALEWDDKDEQALHVLAVDNTGAGIGTGRISQEGQIGRMAVLSPWRNLGVGSALLVKLLQLASQHQIAPLFLNAQTKAIPFYQQHGFHCTGDEFMEAGIPHQRMEQKTD
ncbi:MAG: GNAT family N-acetyltransferase [Sedimenticola selenatireducens]|uniref:GNAT family N-acetyltransferase n=1 Tax=Sedimenticola selenatireducens TaxID=191960 RepID=A0A557SEW8_9GAMM|nr:GNAT family N-acetyltransferase [Sedimenticola selenatireducens]TVT63793.1 MAG: GNAT family N-acetyltransferase [Sedimenticola selenatireducens]